MSPTLEAFLRSWPFDPWLVGGILLTAGIYLRGWLVFARRGSPRWGRTQLYAFTGGLAALWLALASPIDPFSSLLLQVHMLQHLLLMMVAPPLIWLGAPMLPLLRGLPEPVRRYWIGPLLRQQWLRVCFQRLTHPFVALVLFVGSTWLWHAPAFFDAALRSDRWHYLEHIVFLGTALLFWWPVVQPFPARPLWPRWWVLPYLLLADLQNTALSALLSFSDRVLYPHYETVPRIGGFSALEDQSIAGVLMWVPGSLAFLIPLMGIGWQLLYGQGAGARSQRSEVRGQKSEVRSQKSEVGGQRSEVRGHARVPLRLISPIMPTSKDWDLLNIPFLGRFLQWRHARLALQLPLFGLALMIIVDGLIGPPLAFQNLAGVLPWIHWRGLLVLGLLIAGNVFCMACPFMLPRSLARRWLKHDRPWPRWLRSKWLAVGLLVLFFWSYEAFDLWASPWWTAWIALAYFGAALVIDGWFRGASFCKYVCPIGQFNFAQSLVSPLEVRVRDPEACRQCATKDCIRGGNGIPGCELNLFQPRKASNLDCTFCLDCIHACPHDNIGVLAVVPGAELVHDRHRSGVGRWSRRPDLAALVLVLVFGAFANAAGMVAPVVNAQDRLAGDLGLASSLPVLTVGLLGALLVVPAVLVGSATTLSRWCSGNRDPWLAVALRFTYALLPLGCGMWLTHYLFHFLTSADSLLPVCQRLAVQLGVESWGSPAWDSNCCLAVASWILRLEIIFLDLGFLLSLYTAYRIAQECNPRFIPALKAFLPWAVLIVLLFTAGLWIVFQPMEMRGTMQVIR